MPKYKFHVVGIRHHDYAGKLDELYQRAEGKSMTMHLEDENVMEENAVRVYLSSKFVGYIRTGAERMMAEELVRKERLSVIGQVTEIDRKNRIITLEVDSDAEYECKGRERSRALRNWKYYGEKLRQADEEVSLNAMLNNLQMCVEQQEEWDETMTQYLDFIEANLWRDAGVESQRQLDTIEHLLTANSDVIKGYKEAAQRVVFIMTDVNSPESRQKLVDYMNMQARSEEVACMISNSEEACKKVNKLPYSLRRLFDRNPQEYVGRLRYLRFPYRKIRQLQTLMVMRIALDNRNEYDSCNSCNVLIEQEGIMDNLTIAINRFFNDSPKNLALIFCVLRDLGLLVNPNDYKGFVNMLNNKGILHWMTEKEMRNLACSLSQYMRDRKDHNKLREGFSRDFRSWEDNKERALCEKIASIFIDETEI